MRQQIAARTSIVEVLFLLGWFEYLEGAHERFVNTHERACIVELAAVVGC